MCVRARALAWVACGWACALASWPAGGEALLASAANQLTEPREGSCRSRPGRRPFRATPGQVSAPRGPRLVPRLRPGPAQVTRRWPRVTWVSVGAREGAQGVEGSKLPQSRVGVDVDRRDTLRPAARSSRTTCFSRVTP